MHQIHLLFEELYPKKWICTGISKGGLTAVAYKYFYPNDVSATIALSTSIKLKSCDTTYFHYIDSLSKVNACRQDLKNFQRRLLSNRKELIPLLKEHFNAQE